jgi:excinuclease UvrABC ATPase subunit
VIVIEHHLDVVKTADYVIDLGPEGGHSGGEVVVTGTPEDVARSKASYTGSFLRAQGWRVCCFAVGLTADPPARYARGG